MPVTRAIRAGGLLVPEQQAAPEHAVGRRTWEEFLVERLS
jgi:hypothetical protein